MNQAKPTAILVAGMHRSGTSALTGALGAMGIALGGRMLAPGSDNPKGYWEHEDAVGIHERLLASLGRHWDDVRALPEGWQASEAARAASAEIGELISRDFAQSTVWAIKDPRICRFLPLWLEVTKQLDIHPVVLFVARRPSEVAASIEARNHWASPIGELLWLRHVLEADAASRAVQRATVTYDDLLADPEVVISAALNRLGVRHESEHGVLERLIDISDRHHRHAAVEEASSGFGAIAETAYMALAGTAQGGDTWAALRECAVRFDELWQTRGASIDAIADMAHQIRLKEAAAQLEILDLSSKLNAQVQWSERAVEIRSEMRAEYQLALDAIAMRREQLAQELESASIQAAQAQAQAQAQYEAACAAFAIERDRLTGELESATARTAQERADHESACEALAAQRDRLAGELESASVRAAQQQTEHMTALGALVSERNRLAGELESASTHAMREQARHAAMSDTLAAERNRLADELEAAVERAVQEQAWHAKRLDACAAERDALASELEAAIARFKQERQRHESQVRELSLLRDADKEALHAAHAEVSSRNAMIAELQQSWSWRVTRPLRTIGRLLRSKSVQGTK